MTKKTAEGLKLNSSQAGEYLGMTRTRVRDLTDQGLIHGTPAEYDRTKVKKTGRVQMRFTLSDLDKYRAEEKQRQAAREAARLAKKAPKAETQPETQPTAEKGSEDLTAAVRNLAGAVDALRAWIATAQHNNVAVQTETHTLLTRLLAVWEK